MEADEGARRTRCFEGRVIETGIKLISIGTKSRLVSYLSDSLTSLSDNYRHLSDTCRTLVGHLSDNCRTLVGQLSVFGGLAPLPEITFANIAEIAKIADSCW